MAGMEDISTQGVIADAQALVKAGSTDAMTLWTDEKRGDFVKVFEGRSRASKYILAHTASELIGTALRRQFVGRRAWDRFQDAHKAILSAVRTLADGEMYKLDYNHPQYRCIGGRTIDELNAIAEKRAEEIFANLPSLKQAVQVIRPEVSKKIDALEKLREKMKKLVEEVDDPALSAELRLSQVDQDMTIAAFRVMVKARVEKRRKIIHTLEETSKEAKELDDEIAKDLYAGIPEIQEAILDVAKKHYEQAAAMGAMTRRVEEHVKFGDSQAAVDIVKRFEQDEAAVSPNIKKEFDDALARLKLSGPQVRKQLAAKKKEK